MAASLECPRPACRSLQVLGTGRFNESRFGRRRAELECVLCGHRWSSMRPDAIAAGEEAGGASETPPPKARVQPLPSTHTGGHGHGFVRVGRAGHQVVSRHLDVKARQTGERE